MSILISPSDNTGWGLGTGKMYGGARKRSAEHPVHVRSYWRAAWGSRNRRRVATVAAEDAEAPQLEDVAQAPATVPIVRRHRRRVGGSARTRGLRKSARVRAAARAIVRAVNGAAAAAAPTVPASANFAAMVGAIANARAAYRHRRSRAGINPVPASRSTTRVRLPRTVRFHPSMGAFHRRWWRIHTRGRRKASVRRRRT
ncbi:pVII [Murine mastadenovirus A]|uniref:Pre-histone-like nucleoprotein n=1 Tax=Murine adenovirus A serotype 1 TaxID=10530 RepID=NP_ADEM1|nr:precursor to major core protein [Murine mastadenovirus A]AP_000347.1 pVII [Murine mastadenovirus A]O10440.1 RecName: Full=Pre-histone-like nucleoprotein; AltName: Full=Pre-core protein VII; Short=pVII; Contains: RecName: Full=Histone-like nucleoprotein; Short=NP; AltName: Full=Core protein VII [Murine adenovirus 1]AAB53755.1 pVII [Murine adenovirus 1]